MTYISLTFWGNVDLFSFSFAETNAYGSNTHEI